MSLLSSYITSGDKETLSVKYNNLYSIKGEIFYITTNYEELPYVKKFTNMYDWRPNISIHESEKQVDEFLSGFDIEEVELSVFGDNIWYGNIGHALFDGLYPLYVALNKFGHYEEDFVLLSSDWSNKKAMCYGIVTKFSGNNLMEYNHLDKTRVIRFKNLISGTGGCGNRIINETYTLYGQKEFNSLSSFRNRMYSRYGLKSNKKVSSPLNAIIIKNKRFSEKETQIIHQAIDHFKDSNEIKIKYVDWYHDYYENFEKQLIDLQEVDIHITGPGTGMMYMPFLKDGAVNVNLGYIEKTQTNTARPNIKIEDSNAEDHIFPGFMEQAVCNGTNYVKTLYYDRYTYNDIEIKPLIEIIQRAIKFANNNDQDNLNIDAKIFLEYCKRCDNTKQVCEYLTGIAFFIELFVNEHPVAIPKDLIDVELLRKIKKEFNYDRRYEINTN